MSQILHISRRVKSDFHATERCDSGASGRLFLRLQQLEASAWKVTDGRLAEDDPRALLGFIEKRGAQFELMQVGAEFSWSSFDSLEQALVYVIGTGEQTALDRAAGDLSWLFPMHAGSGGVDTRSG
jgi:hypothetical protein